MPKEVTASSTQEERRRSGGSQIGTLIQVIVFGSTFRYPDLYWESIAEWPSFILFDYAFLSLFFNPGSAGPVRFSLPVTLGKIRIEKSSIAAEIVEINEA